METISLLFECSQTGLVSRRPRLFIRSTDISYVPGTLRGVGSTVLNKTEVAPDFMEFYCIIGEMSHRLTHR